MEHPFLGWVDEQANFILLVAFGTNRDLDLTLRMDKKLLSFILWSVKFAQIQFLKHQSMLWVSNALVSSREPERWSKSTLNKLEPHRLTDRRTDFWLHRAPVGAKNKMESLAVWHIASYFLSASTAESYHRIFHK